LPFSCCSSSFGKHRSQQAIYLSQQLHEFQEVPTVLVLNSQVLTVPTKWQVLKGAKARCKEDQLENVPHRLCSFADLPLRVRVHPLFFLQVEGQKMGFLFSITVNRTLLVFFNSLAQILPVTETFPSPGLTRIFCSCKGAARDTVDCTFRRRVSQPVTRDAGAVEQGSRKPFFGE
jgi:hypothetical protein